MIFWGKELWPNWLYVNKSHIEEEGNMQTI